MQPTLVVGRGVDRGLHRRAVERIAHDVRDLEPFIGERGGRVDQLLLGAAGDGDDGTVAGQARAEPRPMPEPPPTTTAR